ncbi:MAG: ABC transporter ATP-binding protein [Firmicutes bacterium]|nr:ABC transporter ATP-binding protein [Bacillota bacterium]
MIQVEDVVKRFKDFYALNGVSLDIASGQYVAVVGPSGSGKSTLLNVIGQIDDITSGEIFVGGVATSGLLERERASLRNKKFGYVFQAFYLEPRYSVYKNIEIPLIIAGVKGRARRERVEYLLELVGLTQKIKNAAGSLSGGEKQRVALARALTNDPQIILADEPCGNLDSANSEIVLNLLADINKQGKTLILVTHNMEHANLAERIIRLQDGKLVEH